MTSHLSPLLPSLLLLVFLFSSSAQDFPLPRELGRFSLPFAGFIEAHEQTDFQGDPRDRYTLYLSTFNAGTLLSSLLLQQPLLM